MITAQKGYLVDRKLSPNQLSKSKVQYIKEYIFGEPSFQNKYTSFGSWVHGEIENGNSENPALDFMITGFTRLSEQEVKIEANFKEAGFDVILNGRADSYGEKEDALVDYKTSKLGKWNLEEVKNSDQFKFYNLIHKINTGRFLKKIIVENIITEEDEYGNLYLTGDSFRYTYEPTEEESVKDTEYIAEKIKTFVTWVESLDEQNVNDLTKITAEGELPDEINFAIEQKNEAKRKIDALSKIEEESRNIVKSFLETQGIAKLKTATNNIYFSVSNEYEYDEEILEIEKELEEKKALLKKKKEEFEKTHQPVGTKKTFTFK